MDSGRPAVRTNHVTVQTGLCIYCIDRTKEQILSPNGTGHASSLSRSDFNWLDASNSEGI